MTPDQTRIQQLLSGFAPRTGATLTLDNGVCALYDEQGQEALVLEMPPQGDALLLHCQLLDMRRYETEPAAWRLMMTLNFEMNAMRGCWLALDEDNQIRLCHQQPVSALSEVTFAPLLEAFIQQAREARDLLLDTLSGR